MVNIMNEMSIVLLILVVITIAFKISHMFYEKNLKEKSLNNIVSLMKKEASYKRYKEISNKSLRPNMPKRKSGDFFDFIFEQIDGEQSYVENGILGIYGEDYNE